MIHAYDKSRVAEVKREPASIINDVHYKGFQYFPGASLEYFSKELALELCLNWKLIDEQWLSGCLCCTTMLLDGGSIEVNATRWIVDAIDDLTLLRAIKIIQHED